MSERLDWLPRRSTAQDGVQAHKQDGGHGSGLLRLSTNAEPLVGRSKGRAMTGGALGSALHVQDASHQRSAPGGNLKAADQARVTLTGLRRRERLPDSYSWCKGPGDRGERVRVDFTDPATRCNRHHGRRSRPMRGRKPSASFVRAAGEADFELTCRCVAPSHTSKLERPASGRGASESVVQFGFSANFNDPLLTPLRSVQPT